MQYVGPPCWLSGKESTCNARGGDVGDVGSIPGSGRSSGREHGTPLHYSCLGNSMDRGAWWATVHGVTKTRPQLNKEHTHTHTQPSDHQVLDPGVGTPALSGGLGGAWMQTPAGRGRTGWMTFGASRYWEQPEQPALGPRHGSTGQARCCTAWVSVPAPRG